VAATALDSIEQRLRDRAREWHVVVTETVETTSSLLAHGSREGRPVTLKIVRTAGDEWRAGEVLAAFDGRGMVRVHEFVPGAMLLERLQPGRSLVDLSLAGHDDEATAILSDVIAAMSPAAAPNTFVTVHDWGRGFARYSASGAALLPPDLVSQAENVFTLLSNSQTHPRLLHGDLQHYNVLFDRTRAWVAIDPKGVIGELEYEIGAALRNPAGRPDLFATPAIIERRISRFAARLKLDVDRTLAWAFAQAVLSAIWEIEDGPGPSANFQALAVAAAIRPMLPDM
jgi:streptomycin 6-kinase